MGADPCGSENVDRRAVRTRRALVEAVRSLLPAHAWDEVSVQRICDVADVSRSAFYAHFAGRHEVLDATFDAFGERLGVPVAGRGLDAHGTFALLPALVSHVRASRALVERNAPARSGVALFDRFRLAVAEAARREARRSERFGAVPAEAIDFAVGGALARLERWREGGFVASEAAVLAELDRYAGAVLGAAAPVRGRRTRP